MFPTTKHCRLPHPPSPSVPPLRIDWKRMHCLPPAALPTVSLSCSWQQSSVLMEKSNGRCALRFCCQATSWWPGGRQSNTANLSSDKTQMKMTRNLKAVSESSFPSFWLLNASVFAFWSGCMRWELFNLKAISKIPGQWSGMQDENKDPHGLVTLVHWTTSLTHLFQSSAHWPE